MRNIGNKRPPAADTEIDDTLVEIVANVRGTRALRTGLLQLAYELGQRPEKKGILVLDSLYMTEARLNREWEDAKEVFRPDLMQRIQLFVNADGSFTAVGGDQTLAPLFESKLREAVEKHRKQRHPTSAMDAGFVIRKVLLNQWLIGSEANTLAWLSRTSGLSYVTVSAVLRSLGSVIERSSNRSVQLKWFPAEELNRIVALSDRARSTVRFADRSGGEPRSAESHLRRLERMRPPGVAIGGVLGARRYYPDLDLVGTPRLDLSVHVRSRPLDLDFVEELDPALKRIEDPLEPAVLAIHAVRHADSLFEPRPEGLPWADRVECLLDLYEARLEMQANQFFDALKRARPTPT